jgi:hypothetical protein
MRNLVSREALVAWGITGVAFAVAYYATVTVKPLFAPDSRYYLARTLWFTGTSKEEAARIVADRSAVEGWESPAVDLLFGWGLVQPRVVYSALSAPFVKAFGIDGMLVVPAVATALFALTVLVLLGRRWNYAVALVPVLLILSSQNLVFWFSAMLTESLTALWTAILLALVWRYQKNPSVLLLVAIVGVTTVSAFTRQSTLIPAGAFAAAWFLALVCRTGARQWFAPATAILVTAVGLQLLQTWLFPSFSQADQFMMKTGADSLGGAIAASPGLAWDILTKDVLDLMTNDRPLLLLLVLAVLSMVVFWRRSESHMLFGALCAYELYNVTNGTPTAFRYGTPGLVFVALSVGLLVAAALRRPEAHDRARATDGTTRDTTGDTQPV